MLGPVLKVDHNHPIFSTWGWDGGAMKCISRAVHHAARTI